MATQSPQQKVTPPGRMSLKNRIVGRMSDVPLRVLLYGVEGVGKSTFGANAPAPIFLGTEDGTSQLDVERFPQPGSWAEVLEAVDVLQRDEHDRKTLVIDTLDWIEPLCWEHTCKRHGQTDIESFGYGKGYTAALEEWRILLSRLDSLRRKGMHVVLLGHSWIKPFKNPEIDGDYDRYELKLHNKTSGLVKEWCDAVLFANHETATKKVDGQGKRVRGIATGLRLMHTERRAAYDAKNRFGLPETMPLSWEEFYRGARGGDEYVRTLRAQIDELLPRVDDATRKAGSEWLAKTPNPSVGRLAELANKLRAKADQTDKEPTKEESK
jgi:AAA domain-containing protein